MKYRVVHSTEYHYSAPVGFCHNEARLLPRQLPGQTCLAAALQIEPAAGDYHERSDFFGNRVACFTISQPHDRLLVTATSEVELAPRQVAAEPGEGPAWELVRDRLRSERTPEVLDALQYALDSPMIVAGEALADYARASFPPGRPLAQAVHELMQRIHADFAYDPHFSSVATPLAEVLEHRRGVCQDFAHLAIGCLRAQGLAARYVSGYLETLPPPGQPKLVGADASHAWFSVFAPGRGWLDFDPTNNQVPREQHITLAWGRDFSDVTPLKGVAFGGGQHRLLVSVDVQSL